MDLLKIGAQLFMSKLGSGGSGLDASSVVSSLSNLLPTSGGDLDLSALVGKMNSGGLASIASSFLGGGSNDAFSPSQLMGLLGESKVSEFASSLNIEKDTAAQGLSDMIPDLIDKQSEGGSLLGGIAASSAKDILGKFF